MEIYFRDFMFGMSLVTLCRVPNPERLCMLKSRIIVVIIALGSESGHKVSEEVVGQVGAFLLYCSMLCMNVYELSLRLSCRVDFQRHEI